jgi:hypothetical protein
MSNAWASANYNSVGDQVDSYRYRLRVSGLSQLNSVPGENRLINIDLGVSVSICGTCPRADTSLLLRKEVIQPQVPLRLPCYDLVPITGLTFGRRSGLRVLPAFVT